MFLIINRCALLGATASWSQLPALLVSFRTRASRHFTCRRADGGEPAFPLFSPREGNVVTSAGLDRSELGKCAAKMDFRTRVASSVLHPALRTSHELYVMEPELLPGITQRCAIAFHPHTYAFARVVSRLNRAFGHERVSKDTVRELSIDRVDSKITSSELCKTFRR